MLTKCGTLISKSIVRGCWKPPKCSVTYHYHVHQDLTECADCEEVYIFDPSNLTFIESVDNCFFPATDVSVSQIPSLNTFAKSTSMSQSLGCTETSGSNLVTFSVDGCGIPTWIVSGMVFQEGFIYYKTGEQQESLCISGTNLSVT